MAEQYKNPPITEAVCELRFRSDSPWDLADPGLIFSALKDSFPYRLPTPAPPSSFSFSGSDPEIQAQINQLLRQDISTQQGLRFWRDDSGQGQIVIAQNRLAVSQFPPYPSWEAYLPIIDEVSSAYINTVQPTGVQRIGLRYINDIAFPLGPVELEEYFDFFPFLGDRLPQDHGAIQIGINFEYFGGRDVIRLQMGTRSSKLEGQVTIRLDLDYYLAKPEEVKLDGTVGWLKQAHDTVEAIFEGCLKEKARSMFNNEST